MKIFPTEAIKIIAYDIGKQAGENFVILNTFRLRYIVSHYQPIF